MDKKDETKKKLFLEILKRHFLEIHKQKERKQNQIKYFNWHTILHMKLLENIFIENETAVENCKKSCI